MVINTTATGVETATHDISMDDIDTQQAYTQQQRFDGHARAVAHGVVRKEVFNKKVLRSNAGEVVFEVGDLVQVLDPKFKKTFLTSKKILPEWLGTFWVKERLLNSYVIETIYGQELDGKYNSKQLRPLKVPAGSSLEAYEAARKAGRLDGRAADEAGGEEAQNGVTDEQSEDEEDTDGAREEDDEEGDGWEDEDAEGSTIGARLRARRAVTRATRMLPQGGEQMR
jgi:hypothetical protein